MAKQCVAVAVAIREDVAGHGRNVVPQVVCNLTDSILRAHIISDIMQIH